MYPMYQTDWEICAIPSQCLRWRMVFPVKGKPSRKAGSRRTGLWTGLK